MHASQIQGCIVEQRVEKKRKIVESGQVRKSENGGSSIFRRRTESVEPAADWTEKNTIDICLSPRTENAPLQPCIGPTAPI